MIMCDGCENGEHWRCGMQTWCQCDCDGSLDWGACEVDPYEGLVTADEYDEHKKATPIAISPNESEKSWLDVVVQAGGLNCGNCSQWRILQGREIERCKGCDDDAIDAYDLAAQWEAADIGG